MTTSLNADQINPSDLPVQPSTVRVLSLLAGVAWRRVINQMSMAAAFWRKKPPADASVRQATPGRRRSRALLLFTIWVTLTWIVMAWSSGCMLVERLSTRLESTDTSTAENKDGFDRVFQSGAVWPAAPNDR